jgi:hypothetical protein
MTVDPKLLGIRQLPTETAWDAVVGHYGLDDAAAERFALYVEFVGHSVDEELTTICALYHDWRARANEEEA